MYMFIKLVIFLLDFNPSNQVYKETENSEIIKHRHSPNAQERTL